MDLEKVLMIHKQANSIKLSVEHSREIVTSGQWETNFWNFGILDFTQKKETNTQKVGT